jgi:hypothetical protein
MADALLAEVDRYVASERAGEGLVTVAACPTIPAAQEWIREVRLTRQPDGSVAPAVAAERGLLAALVRLGLLASGGLLLRCLHQERHPLTGQPRATVRGWQLGAGRSVRLDEAALFAACCTDAETGEPLPPELEVVYLGQG